MYVYICAEVVDGFLAGGGGDCPHHSQSCWFVSAFGNVLSFDFFFLRVGRVLFFMCAYFYTNSFFSQSTHISCIGKHSSFSIS